MKDVLDLFGDLPDFPGKRTPKNRPEPKQTNSILDDRFNGAKGKEYIINNQRYIMYTVGEVAKALKRSPVTIRMWEHNGWIPKPSFRTPPPAGSQIPNKATKGRRLYTAEQLDILVTAVELFGVEEHFSADWDGFKEYIKANWKR